jgi:hypothetical protein
MDLSKLNNRERLVSVQAVLTLRALDEAADHAPHGKGLASLEAVIHEQGFVCLRTMLAAAAAAATTTAASSSCWRRARS